MVLINKKFIDDKVQELYERGLCAAKIGAHLRDNYLIQSKSKLCKTYSFLKSKEAELEGASSKLEKRIEHFSKNKKDYVCKNAIQKIKPFINKLKKQL